nr:tigger transposable element-derived protein 4-like isoform X1 [Dermacentor andersoni]
MIHRNLAPRTRLGILDFDEFWPGLAMELAARSCTPVREAATRWPFVKNALTIITVIMVTAWLSCNSRAWMTCSLFEEFLLYFDKMGAQCRSVILFLDNCAAQPRDPPFLWNVKLVFLPPNTTSHLQPLDASAIKNLKHSYRKCIVKRWLVHIDRGQQPAIISVLDAMHYVASAWTAVSASTAQHCFARCGFHVDGEMEAATEAEELQTASCEEELAEVMNALGAMGVAYDDYVAVDAAVVMSECQSIAEIVENSVASEAADCDDDEEHEPHDAGELRNPSFAEAVAALDLPCRYVSPHSDAAAFEAIEKRVVISSERKKQQATILDFLSPKHSVEIHCLKLHFFHSFSELSSLLRLPGCYVFFPWSGEKRMNGVPLYSFRTSI